MATTPPRPERRVHTEAEYSGWALVAGMAGIIGLSLGAMGVVLFAHPEAELATGAALLVVDVAFAVVTTATGWQGPRGKYGFLALALGWLICTVASSVLLATSVFDNVSPGWPKAALWLALGLSPYALVLASAAVTEQARRRWASRRAGSAG